jgi:hypothetical protein
MADQMLGDAQYPRMIDVAPLDKPSTPVLLYPSRQ